jgi:hypothetical protein
MTSDMRDVVERLRALIAAIDRAVGATARAQRDAEQAHAALDATAPENRNPKMARAIADIRTAKEKTGKTARLLAEAANAFADYTNVIAPGTLPAQVSNGGADPLGAQIVEDTAARQGSFLERLAKKADDVQDAVTEGTKTAAGAKTWLQHVKGAPPAPPPASTSTPGIGAIVRNPAPQNAPNDVVTGLAITGLLVATIFSTVKKRLRLWRKGG